MNATALQRYQAALNGATYDNTESKALKEAYIRLGYPASLFNIQSTKQAGTNITPSGWTAPAAAGRTYGELQQVNGRNFMWDGYRWVPKA